MRRLLVAMSVAILLLNAALFFYYKEKDSPVRIPPVQQPNKPSDTPIDHPQEKAIVPVFTDVPKFRDYSGDSVYADVLNHSQDTPFGNGHGRATNVHETAHGIHAYLRNKSDKKINGFYALKGRAVIIEEPNVRKSRVAEFVPQNLRSYRFDTYITGQRAWDDTPLYTYDEWTAYVLGAMTNVEDVKNGQYHGEWTDGVSGSLEFSIYAIATCMAVEKYDPQYWKNNEQFRNYTIWMLKQARGVFIEGHLMEQFKWEKQDQLLDALRESSAAAPVRKFMHENLEGVWLEEGLQVLDLQYQDHQRVLLSTTHESLRLIQP